eukprot:gene40659-32974_t
MMPSKGLSDEEKEPLQQLLSLQAEGEAMMVRSWLVICPPHEEKKRRIRGLLSACAADRDGGEQWCWSSEQEDELRGKGRSECAGASASKAGACTLDAG